MTMYDDILVPTDGRPGTAGAVSRALDLGRTFDARIHALFVADAAVETVAGSDELAAVQRGLGEAAVDAIADRAAEFDVPAEVATRAGRVHEAILDYVDEVDIDLVVMGTRGRSGLPHLGSSTQRVLARAAVPVMVVRLESPDLAPGLGMYDRVVVATDGSDTAERAFEHGLGIAERYGADLRVIYVVDTTTYGLADAPRSIVGILKEGGQTAARELVEAAEGRQVPASFAVLRGVPEDAILQYATGAEADLLAMGVRGVGVSEPFLGSTAARVVRSARMPVLTVG
ncbi:MAG: universal stress protein [Halobacteriota archaeon]